VAPDAVTERGNFSNATARSLGPIGHAHWEIFFWGPRIAWDEPYVQMRDVMTEDMKVYVLGLL
jgi:hypothetical protein